MDLRHMHVLCGIPDLNNLGGNFPTQMFIDSQGFKRMDDFYMLRIKDAPHMINDHNLVPNQDARFGAIQQSKLQALVWWAKDIQRLGLVIIAAAWTGAYMTSSIMKINIESPSIGDIKVAQSGKVDTGHKCTTWDITLDNHIGYMLGVSVIPLNYVTRCDMKTIWAAANKHNRLKYRAV